MLDKKWLFTKILSICFVLVIITISVLIFMFREKIQGLGSLGYIGVFFLCFICNATVLAPAPSLLVVASAALALNPFFVALLGAIGTTLGELIGYYTGYMGKNIVDVKSSKLTGWLVKYGTLVIFLFALLPMPLFDIIGVASGYFRIRMHKFAPACFLGKFIKMAIIAFCAGYLMDYFSI